MAAICRLNTRDVTRLMYLQAPRLMGRRTHAGAGISSGSVCTRGGLRNLQRRWHRACSAESRRTCSNCYKMLLREADARVQHVCRVNNILQPPPDLKRVNPLAPALHERARFEVLCHAAPLRPCDLLGRSRVALNQREVHVQDVTLLQCGKGAQLTPTRPAVSTSPPAAAQRTPPERADHCSCSVERVLRRVRW